MIWVAMGTFSAIAQVQKQFDQDAVWSPSQNALSELNNCPGLGPIYSGTEKEKIDKMIKCAMNTMKKHGASQQAIQFAKFLTGKESFIGYMSDFTKKGVVDLCGVSFPLRANTNDVLYMVNGTPAIISTEEHLRNINISKHPLYIKLLNKYPRLELWQCSGFKEMKGLRGGGQRFVFSYFLKNGCNACEVGGFASIAYDFDQKGAFKGTELLGITENGSHK
jgi:hypothetical protein